MPRRRSLKLLLLSAPIILAGVVAWWVVKPGEPQARHEPVALALFTTLPIYWGESADMSEILGGEAQAHWARTTLEQDFELLPVDVLTQQSLAPHRRLLMAQPRSLSPVENVALDEWVRDGGHLLLFADPMLTEESRFAPGDPRRPADVALLSPILGHWGLSLEFVEDQPAGEHLRETMGAELPVDMPGRFATAGQGNCRLWGDGLAVTCAIGEGRLVAFADAAVLDSADETGARREALGFLLDTVFAAR